MPEAISTKTEREALLRDCPLCYRPRSQFASIVELPGDLGWQVLHQCPDDHAKAVGGETRETAIDAWNLYCELTKPRAAALGDQPPCVD